MKKLTKILRKEEKGFTLIELIVVIAILGIIAAIAVPQYMGTVTTAKNKADIATAHSIADAAVRYMSETQSPILGTDNTISYETLKPNYLSKEPVAQNTSGFTIKVDQTAYTVTVSFTPSSPTGAVAKNITEAYTPIPADSD